MTTSLYPTTSRRIARGFSLIELMISLAISAILLVSVASAIFACTHSFRANQEQGLLNNRTRMVMNTLLSRIRMTDQVEPYTAAKVTDFKAHALTVDASSNAVGIEDVGFKVSADMGDDSAAASFTATDMLFTYRYDSDKQQLVLVKGTSEFVLLDGVTDFKISLYPGKTQTDKDGNLIIPLDHAVISMSVATSRRSVQAMEATSSPMTASIAASVYPRRSTWLGGSSYNEIPKLASAN